MKKLAALTLALCSACASTRQPPSPLESPDGFQVGETVHPPYASGALGEDGHVASGTKFAIAAQGRETAAAGERMFAAGGNIIDAAVAVSFAIAVERPQSTGIGGGGFLLFREAATGRVYAADFRERAPLRATRDMYLDRHGQVVPERSLNGILSVATPGLVAGLVEVQKRWGKLPLAAVLAPAIDVAENGLTVTPALAAALASRRDVIARNPAAAKIFLKADGTLYKEGEKIVQKDLAKTLRRVAAHGKDGFYQGAVAQSILRTSRQLHGILAAKDLASYQVKWREPLHGSFRGFELFSMPPPSSGGIHVLQILNMLENDPLRDLHALSPEALHREASAMQLAYADRAVYPGDPDFVAVPTDWLISKEYARSRRALIGDRAKPAAEVRAGRAPGAPTDGAPKAESPETTHFSIMDAEGNAVSSTQTINYAFGSGVVAEGTGVLLNDEMDDFSAKPGSPNVYGALGGDANAIAPGKRPLSSMSPTIAVKDGQPVMTVGAPGGTRITTCVAQTILNYLAFGLTPYDSVAAVRLHEQWMPDTLFLEPPGPGASTVAALEAKGWNVSTKPGEIFCRVELVVREGAKLIGVSDPRDAGRSVAK